ncbi:MAG: class I SAM-dependent methyltransferase [Anaerolineae bacterium]|nr:class I SAM-dependent methyltransferase [Anaerolineales bacterium]MCQ3972337.1 class I SAM-dependent methyltransferase [Anaerolineae bacterium]
MSHHDRLLEFYQTGPVPWDLPDPPPEVLAFVPTLPVGRALDLGCGLGRAALYMARLGWQVDGVDFIAQALSEATHRATQAGLANKIHFHLGPVTRLDFLIGPYDFALDVGCAHSFELDELRAYHRELLRLLKPGAPYLLFAHLNKDEAEQDPEARCWLDEADLYQVFAEGFTLERVEYGQTQVGDQAPWRSAWFWFRRA